MALHTAAFHELPPGTIPITKQEAVRFQLNIMQTLCPVWDRKFIKYGPVLCSLFTGLSGTSIFRYYRNAVNLRNPSLINFAVVIGAPTLATALLHENFVRDHIIIQKWACPFCYPVKSSALQLFFGVIYPVFVGSVTSFSQARIHKLHDVPPLNRKSIIDFFYKITKPYSKPIFAFSLMNILCGTAIVFLETNENNHFNANINSLIDQYEKNMAHSNVV